MKLPAVRPTAIENFPVEYEKFFSVSLDMLCISSYDGHFKKVNPAFEVVLGFSPEEMCNKPYLDFIHPDDVETTINEVKKQHEQKAKVFNFQNRYRCKDGSYKWLSWNSVPVGDFMYAVARDMTAERKAKDDLQSLNHELELFSYSVAHDLRAPARSVLGFTTLILEDTLSILSPDSKDYLARVLKAGDKMGVLIDGLLSLSKLAKKQIAKQVIDLSLLVSDTAKDLQSADPLRQVNFIIKPKLVVQGDLVLLKIAIENLMSNAWKYSSKCTHSVTIEFGSTENGVFFIRDNGAGFESQYTDKLFGVFQRLHSAQEFEGTGIGLATTQRIIQRHGGKIWAKSEVGQGATFYFTFQKE